MSIFEARLHVNGAVFRTSEEAMRAFASAWAGKTEEELMHEMRMLHWYEQVYP